jgi:hypothetical protein
MPLVDYRAINTTADWGLKSLALLFSLSAVIGFSACDFAKDQSDAKAVAERVHSQMQAGDYSTIYKESAPYFKTIGTEAQFVALMQKHQSDVGPLKAAREIAFEAGADSTVGKIQVFVYDLEFERARVRQRLVLTRSDSGQMQLRQFDFGPIQ